MDRPMPRYRYRRFYDCSVSEKILDSLFLITMGVGYLLATVYLYTGHQWMDDKPGLSVADVVYSYYGNRSGAKLEAALRGKMLPYATYDERETIIKWIEAGSPESGYEGSVKPIIESRCITCHAQERHLRIPNLTGFENVKGLTASDTGKSIGELAKVSHIHLFGVGFLMFLVGKIFILCEIPVALKRIVVVIPFIAIAMDIGSWWLAHWRPLFAYTVIAGGALIGISLAFQIVVSLYHMWIYKFTDDTGQKEA